MSQSQQPANTFDWKNPDTHPIRYYDCAEQVYEATKDKTVEQLEAIADVLYVLKRYFWKAHFEQEAVLNQKALVKTLDEIFENVAEDWYHKKEGEASKALQAKADAETGVSTQ
jgi:hypothetical protein